MKENEKSIMTFYDLMERHPRILNLLLGFTLVSLSFVAIFLASDILSSGSHAIHKNGVGELVIQIPKETLEAVKNWRTETFADQIKTNGSNGSSKTIREGMAAGNVSPLGTAVSINSSPDEPSIALQQTSSNIASIAASIAGSTNESPVLITRYNSGGSQSKKARGNDSRTIGSHLTESQLNESQLNKSQLNKSQLNESQLNKSQLNESQLNESKLDSSPSNESHLSRPLPTESSQLNTSQLRQPETNGSESANRSQGIASQMIQAPIVDSLQNKSRQDISQPESSRSNQSESANKSQKEDLQPSQPELTNKSQISNPQSGIAEPMNQSNTTKLPPNQSMTSNKPENEIRTSSQAEATVNKDAGSSGLNHDGGGKQPVILSTGSSASAQDGTNSLELNTTNSDVNTTDASLEPAIREINPASALGAPQQMPARKTISEGSSEQSALKTGSSSSPSPDDSSSTVSSADANKGGDKLVIKTLNFDASQENDGNKVSPDSSGASSKTVSSSKSPAKAGNGKKDETSKQSRPIRAPRKPVPPRHVRSLSRG